VLLLVSCLLGFTCKKQHNKAQENSDMVKHCCK
jgi:hypothetical protein